MLRTIIYMLVLLCAVALFSYCGAQKTAYRLLSASQNWFEAEDEEEPGRKDTSPRRLPGVKVERRVTPLMKKKIGEAYGWKCACGCGQKLSFDYHVDHIIPLWKGGTNDESNLQPLNSRCHAFKTSFENTV